MYGTKEIMEITGYSRSKSYAVIKKVQDKMKADDPDVIIIGARIPIQYFEKYVLCKKNIGKEVNQK